MEIKTKEVAIIFQDHYPDRRRVLAWALREAISKKHSVIYYVSNRQAAVECYKVIREMIGPVVWPIKFRLIIRRS